MRLRTGAWPFTFNSNQLENALLNLAINARDAVQSAGGLLLVTCEEVHLKQYRLRLNQPCDKIAR